MTLTRTEIKNIVGETLGEILGDDEISLGDDTTADDVEDWGQHQSCAADHRIRIATWDSISDARDYLSGNGRAARGLDS